MYQLSEICRVCFPKRDGIDVLNSQLALAMRKFFATGQKPVRVRETGVKFGESLAGTPCTGA